MKVGRIGFSRFGRVAAALALAAAVQFSATRCAAQSDAGGSSDFGYGVLSAIEDYFANWFVRSDAAKASQPHWVTPVVTVTPRLEQEVRYDQYWEARPHNVAVDNFGGSKGVELIPEGHTEIIIGIPGFLNRSKPHHTDGFADLPYLVKLRLLSSNEEHDNYIVTLFMGFTVPTGSSVNGNGHATFTPTLAAGKGFGDFDVQSTVGVTLPSGGLDRLGMPVAWNTAFQYRVCRYFWPEFETNYTWQSYGERNGHNTLYLTPGIVIGRIPIPHSRLGVTVGTGDMIAVTHHPTFNNRWVLTGRIPF
ncbi:MAG TPA: hypothetical protein VEU51_17315 [Candidatus Acidoferrales bacterium]|nr:hypothetical protein [Candidatus Acidoferrales bacterium]